MSQQAESTPKYWLVGVTPESMCAVLSILSEHSLSWSQLVREAITTHITRANESNVDTIVHQHITVAKLFGLINSKDGVYKLQSSGNTLISLSNPEDRNKFLRRKTVSAAVIGNNPLTEFLRYFTRGKSVRTIGQFTRYSKPIEVKYYTSKHVEVCDQDDRPLDRLDSRSSASAVYWGARPFCLAIELIGEVVKPRTDQSKDSILYALRVHAIDFKPENARRMFFEAINDAFKDKTRIRIADLRKAVCVKWGLSPLVFDKALTILHQEYPAEFYLDRVPSILVKQRSKEFIRVDGEWRSFLVMRRNISHWQGGDSHGTT